MMAGSVKAIDRQSVHRICSGQVVLNLATAIKELVENSLDAGATNIDIRLKEYGSEILEVLDNGSGVEKSNFQGLTLKHHTSKLQDFSDLSSVDTFGFRGEALSSLCALSDMTVVTCHESAGVGARLEYDHDGTLIKQTHCPRQCGTTVTLQNLFSTLPVRHKEFLRNLKKEFTKMIQLLQAYGIISSGVKLTCTNQVGQGKRSTVLSTSGNALLKENIGNVFGPKQLQNLMEISQGTPSDEQCEEYGLTQQQLQDQLFKIAGYVSKSDHGSGRSIGDRQYYYINKRPCDFPKVSKVVNEVYHIYNRHQYPFVVLDISLAKESVDVNVTPDKRKIFVLEEKSLLVMLKASLHKMFEPRSSLYDKNSQMSSSSSSSLSSGTGKTETGGLLSQFTRANSNRPSSTSEGRKPDYKGLKVTLAGLKRSFSHSNSPNTDNGGDEINQGRTSKQPKLDAFLLTRSSSEPAKSPDPLNSPAHSRLCSESYQLVETSADDSALPEEEDRLSSSVTHSQSSSTSGASNLPLDKEQQTGRPNRVDTNREEEPSTASDAAGTPQQFLRSSDASENDTRDGEDDLIATNFPGEILSKRDALIGEQDSNSGTTLSNDRERSVDENTSVSMETTPRKTASLDEVPTMSTTLAMDDSSFQPKLSRRREVALQFSIEGLSQTLTRQKDPNSSQKSFRRTFKAVITPSDNSSAEEELKKHVSKDMFPCMEILGQFNLGFIIAKYNRDLFIIDQHATDEKYNFEMLQQHTVLQGQRLIQALPLELTAVSESILMDNLEIFKKNGFDFSIDEEAPPTQRVKLTSLPMSKNWTFGKEDIDEVIFMLSDCPGVMCRPSRVRQMFASRSCRKSIMIGTALSQREMRKLVCHMAEIDQPWNCPHGRPTMRHLFDLDMLPD